ncbi:MAG: preprotein translocase subunit SecG [Faecalibacterium sp.]|jgi:preprotein translocase subunit SecG|nr:preprotein translocase subunit SecG [Faecalibacterium sp.]
MKTYEIVMGVILLVVSVALVFLTLCQHTKGQGLSSAIMGDNSMMGEGRVTHADRMLARFTMIAGVVLFVVAIIACTVSSRLA